MRVTSIAQLAAVASLVLAPVYSSESQPMNSIESHLFSELGGVTDSLSELESEVNGTLLPVAKASTYLTKNKDENVILTELAADAAVTGDGSVAPKVAAAAATAAIVLALARKRRKKRKGKKGKGGGGGGGGGVANGQPGKGGAAGGRGGAGSGGAGGRGGAGRWGPGGRGGAGRWGRGGAGRWGQGGRGGAGRRRRRNAARNARRRRAQAKRNRRAKKAQKARRARHAKHAKRAKRANKAKRAKLRASTKKLNAKKKLQADKAKKQTADILNKLKNKKPHGRKRKHSSRKHKRKSNAFGRRAARNVKNARARRGRRNKKFLKGQQAYLNKLKSQKDAQKSRLLNVMKEHSKGLHGLHAQKVERDEQLSKDMLFALKRKARQQMRNVIRNLHFHSPLAKHAPRFIGKGPFNDFTMAGQDVIYNDIATKELYKRNSPLNREEQFTYLTGAVTSNRDEATELMNTFAWPLPDPAAMV